jgi:hypothetical protein
MRMWKLMVVIGWLTWAAGASPGYAQHDYAAHGGDGSDVLRSLSPEEVRGYREGRGMGLARVAERNQYPGPLHVLELADSLGLTPAQRRAVQASRERMLVRAVPLGHEIVEQEAALEALFRSGDADEAAVRERIEAIGRLQAALRFAHIQAHLEMKQVLTPEQVQVYDRLRRPH